MIDKGKYRTLRFAGEKRVKSLSSSILGLSVCILFFLIFPIHFIFNDNLPLYILAFGCYALVFGGNLFLVINTDKKLFLAPFWHGFFFLVTGIMLIVVVCFSQWAHSLKTIILIIGGYVFLLLAGCWMLQTVRFSESWNRKSKISVGAGIAGGSGYAAAHVFGPALGKDGSEAFLLVSAAIFSVLFGILGLNYILQYFQIKKDRFRNIEWID